MAVRALMDFRWPFFYLKTRRVECVVCSKDLTTVLDLSRLRGVKY